ncbi:MAG: isochorismate synthase, partial [Polyangiaceae bacterium]
LLAEIDERIARAGMETPDPRARTISASVPPDADGVWIPLVEQALADIERGALQKIVVACRASIPEPVSPSATLARLRARNLRATSFSIRREDSVFLGATPERLIFSDKTHALTETLAGTIARRAGADDERAKAELLARDKDLREHGIVVHGITSALAPFVLGIDRPREPSVRTLERVHHLATPIVAKLARATHVLSLVEALHPTPALSGFPKTEAFAWIAAHEPFDRGWYGAPVGWFDDSGEGAFAVAIRSALVTSARTCLYAGSGVVRGSRPDAELAETRLKLETISDSLVLR